MEDKMPEPKPEAVEPGKANGKAAPKPAALPPVEGTEANPDQYGWGV